MTCRWNAGNPAKIGGMIESYSKNCQGLVFKYSRLSLIGTLLIGTICLSEPLLKSQIVYLYKFTTVNRNLRFIGTKKTGPEGFRLTRVYCILIKRWEPCIEGEYEWINWFIAKRPSVFSYTCSCRLFNYHLLIFWRLRSVLLSTNASRPKVENLNLNWQSKLFFKNIFQRV